MGAGYLSLLKPRAKGLVLALSILAGLLVSGCVNVETQIGVYEGGQWTGAIDAEFSAEGLAGLEEEFGEGESALLLGDDAQTKMDEAAERDDIEYYASQETLDDGTEVSKAQAKGLNLDGLNEFLFGNQADISVAEVDGQRQVTIKLAGQEEEEDSGMSLAQVEQMMTVMGISIVYKIGGGEIISHNADELDGNTAIWNNPFGGIEITLLEAPAASMPTDFPSAELTSARVLPLAVAGDGADTEASSDDASSDGTTDADTSDTDTATETEQASTQDDPAAVAPAMQTETMTDTATLTDTTDSMAMVDSGSDDKAEAETDGNMMADDADAKPEADAPANTMEPATKPVPETATSVIVAPNQVILNNQAGNLPSSGGVLEGEENNNVLFLSLLLMIVLGLGAIIGLFSNRDQVDKTKT